MNKNLFIILLLFFAVAAADDFEIKWQYDLTQIANDGLRPGPIPAIQDIDGDGIHEIFLCGTINRTGSTSSNYGSVIALDGSDGSLLWRKDFGGPGNYIDVHCTVAVGDLDNDGTYELVHNADERTIARNAEDGSIFWDLPVPSGWHYTAIVDTDENNLPYVYVSDHSRGTGSRDVTKIRGYDGTVVAQKSGINSCYGGVSAADFEGDGNYEICVSDAPGTGKGLRCFDEDLNQLWSHGNVQLSSHNPVITDVNGDGIFDVVAGNQGGLYHFGDSGVIIVDGSTGETIYNVNNNGMSFHTQPLVADVDYDGHLEIVDGYTNDGYQKVKVFDLVDLQMEYTFENMRISHPPFFLNIMGDEEKEMVFADGWEGYKVYDKNFNLIYGPSWQICCGKPVIQDIDNDGLSEMVSAYMKHDDSIAYVKAMDLLVPAPDPLPRTDTAYYGERRINEDTYFPLSGSQAVVDAYYLSNDGDDSDAGTSPDTAWETIGHLNQAMTDGTIKQGNDVYFRRGDTFSGEVDIRLGGTSSDRMIIGAYGSGDRPVIENSGSASNGNCMILWWDESNHVTIRDLIMKNALTTHEGISVGFSNHTDIVIDNVYGEDIGGSLIFLEKTINYTITDCEGNGCSIVIYGDIYNRQSYGKVLNCTAYGSEVDGFTLHRAHSDSTNDNAGGYHLFQDCKSYDNLEDGFDLTAGYNVILDNCEAWNVTNSLVGIGHDISNLVVQNCYFHDSDSSGIHIGDGSNMIIRNNVVWNSYDGSALGIDSSDGSGWQNEDGYLERCVIYNNDFVYSSSWPHNTNRMVGLTNDYRDDVFVKNNIFVDFSSLTDRFYSVYGGVISPPDPEIDFINNLWYRGDEVQTHKWHNGNQWIGFSEWQSHYPTETYSDPGFTDADNTDLTLATGSNCIDSGDWLTRTVGSGSGDALTVENANYFTDGYGLIDGDEIRVGENTVTVTSVNYDTNVIGIDESISWEDGEPVSLLYEGSAPDIGAFEFVPTGPDTTPPETYIDSGPSGTVNSEEVIFTWHGTDDVSQQADLEYQYSLNGSSPWTSNTSVSYTLTEGSYSFSVFARDEVGNEDSTPATRSFTVNLSSGPECGNGVCEQGEDEDNCAIDCEEDDDDGGSGGGSGGGGGSSGGGNGGGIPPVNDYNKTHSLAFTKEELLEKTRNNSEVLSETGFNTDTNSLNRIAESTEDAYKHCIIHMGVAHANGGTQLDVSIECNKSVSDVVFIVTVPKSFASNASKITVSPPEGVVVVEEDPVYSIFYDELPEGVITHSFYVQEYLDRNPVVSEWEQPWFFVRGIECGNGILEQGEECDGLDGVSEGFKCTSDCNLRELAILSCVDDGFCSEDERLLGGCEDCELKCIEDGFCSEEEQLLGDCSDCIVPPDFVPEPAKPAFIGIYAVAGILIIFALIALLAVSLFFLVRRRKKIPEEVVER